MLAHDNETLDEAHLQMLDQLLCRLIQGEPLPYLIGNQAFYGLDFFVNPEVLIPRPETESLVEWTLAWLASHPQALHGIDIGTGSGCIAITLCKQLPALQMTAVDISKSALDVAKQNAQRHQVAHQIHFHEADLLPDPLPQVDFLCANLPYIPASRCSELAVARFEPWLALSGGENGFVLIDRLITQLSRIESIPFMIFEIDDSHAKLAMKTARLYFPNSFSRIEADLTGRDRFLIIENNQK